MSTLPSDRPGRWRLARFAGVGAGGFVVQVAVLQLLAWAGAHYLIGTAIAVEAAILHNFVWHERWTWRDRPPAPGERWVRALRFNGLTAATSMAGNLSLMWWLAGQLHLPLIVANVLSVAAVSVANYAAADVCVFAPVAPAEPGAQPRRQRQ